VNLANAKNSILNSKNYKDLVMKYKLFSVTVLLSFFFSPNLVYADLLSCGTQTIQNFSVQGSRDDNNVHANMLVITFESQCNNRNFVYIGIDHPSYAAFLTVVLTSFTTGTPVLAFVNTSNSTSAGTQLAILQLTKPSS
jgi:hypothetical protein